jgi:N utilization substance protein B
MNNRHKERQRAFQLLYALEFSNPGDSLDAVESKFLKFFRSGQRRYGLFARDLVMVVHENKDQLNTSIKPKLRKWVLERLPLNDRIILRMALAEFIYFPDIPLRVTLNEYIELARIFSEDKSPRFVNGVLDQLALDFRDKDFECNDESRKSGGKD